MADYNSSYTGVQTDAAVAAYQTGYDRINLLERSTDPADPADGSASIWMSDGTAAGADGDIMVKITAGGVTKTVTLIDYSVA
jgi:hypothetical protein